ncbi:MAG TPA: type II 3-dehydroquinate dehydratase, partial [Candidatus Dadabacteria bacterium]|nr:type II 3-dehydroquinate dehydratase [Candidatus Dadabacteria bacterium]
NREDFRQHSFVSSIALGVISGFGYQSYLMALDAIDNIQK